MFKTELEISELDFLDKIGTTCWLPIINYFIVKDAMRNIYKKYSPDKRFLDIGCGIGIFSPFLNSLGKAFSLDYSYEALAHCKKKGIKELLQADAISLPFKNDIFDAVILLDVVEHIDDDQSLLLEAYRLLRSGGKVFIIVPAFNVLWGSHDVKFCHKRRYSKKSILKAISLTNFKIKRFAYLHPHIFPLMLFYRFIDRRRRDFGKRDDNILLPKSINIFLIWTMKIENFFLQKFSFPFGIKILCILEKG